MSMADLAALIAELDGDMARHAERMEGGISSVPFVATERVLPFLDDYEAAQEVLATIEALAVDHVAEFDGKAADVLAEIADLAFSALR